MNKITDKQIKEICTLEEEYFFNNSLDYKTLLEMTCDKNYDFLFIEKNKKIISYIIIYKSLDFLEIIKICTVSEYRKKGYGEKLLNIIKKDKKDIFAEVDNHNKFIKFYINNGFKNISIRKNYYKNNHDALILKWSSC